MKSKSLSNVNNRAEVNIFKKKDKEWEDEFGGGNVLPKKWIWWRCWCEWKRLERGELICILYEEVSLGKVTQNSLNFSFGKRSFALYLKRKKKNQIVLRLISNSYI